MAVPGDSKLENESYPLPKTHGSDSTCGIYILYSCRDSRAGARGAAAAGGGQGRAASFCGAFGASGAAAHDDPRHVEAQP
jgi:hypothetical protein